MHFIATKAVPGVQPLSWMLYKFTPNDLVADTSSSVPMPHITVDEHSDEYGSY